MAMTPHQQAGQKKGEFQMSIRSSIKRSLVAVAGALAMTAVTVGAAIGPAQAAANPNAVAFDA